MDLQGAFLQPLSVECVHKLPKHGLLVELGMGTKPVAKAACRTESADRLPHPRGLLRLSHRVSMLLAGLTLHTAHQS